MRYEIFGDMMPGVTIKLEPGESIFTQAGGMAWMTEGVQMDTNMRGGLGKAFGRIFTGESMFMATYTGTRSGDEITLTSTMPGEIRAFDIRPGYEIVAQKGAFLGADQSVQVSNFYTHGIKGGLFGGEGFILQKFSGNGTVLCELDGCIRQIDLAPGEVLRVDTGNVAAFESSVAFSAEMVKRFKNILLGGEGLFLSTLRGPGRIWLQTMTAPELAKKLIPYIPVSSGK